MKKEIAFLNKLKKNENDYYNIRHVNELFDIIQPIMRTLTIPRGFVFAQQNPFQQGQLDAQQAMQQQMNYQWTTNGIGGHTLTINNIEGLNNEEAINEDDEILF